MAAKKEGTDCVTHFDCRDCKGNGKLIVGILVTAFLGISATLYAMQTSTGDKVFTANGTIEAQGAKLDAIGKDVVEIKRILESRR